MKASEVYYRLHWECVIYGTPRNHNYSANIQNTKSSKALHPEQTIAMGLYGGGSIVLEEGNWSTLMGIWVERNTGKFGGHSVGTQW